MSIANLGAIEIYYERSGDGPPLLFISGTGGDLRTKPNVFDGPLAKAFDLLAYDQRGLGRSGKPDLDCSMGVITWFVGAFRLLWRLRFAKLPPFPASMPKWQQLTAKANEYGLYGLLLVQPITGLGDTVFRGRPFIFVIWKVPALTHVDKPVFHAFHAAHEIGAIALLALIGFHAVAALIHGVVLRDGVLQRMLPWTRR